MKTIERTARMHRVSRIVLSAAVATMLSLYGGLAGGTHIPTTSDVNVLRPPMPSEGYLNFRASTAPGEERTGWTDIRHPAQATFANQVAAGVPGAAAAATDTSFGYDRSDHFVNLRTTILEDASAPNTRTAPAGGIPDDFDYANKAWAQAGLSVIETATRDVKSPAAANPNSFTFNLSFDEERTIMAEHNAAGTGTVEVYYTDGLDSGGLAEAWYPTLLDGAGNKDEGIFMANTAVAANPRKNTLAHELAHFLTDGQATHQPIVGDASHSRDPRNIVGEPQWDPGSAKNGNNPPWNIAETKDVVGMAMSTNADGSPKVGGTNQIEINQIQTVFSDADVAGWLNIPNDNHATHGDRADFDWVEDNIKLELAEGKADNHPGFDFMVWEIAPTMASAHAGHDHDAWGALQIPDFAGPFLRTVDVVSQIGRYIDMDIDAQGNISRRESALDYNIVEFSIDALNWIAGSLTNVFIPGWHPNLMVHPEDFVARWLSPINARFMRISAFPLGGDHDGNTQIDAVIASQFAVPKVAETASLALLAGALALFAASGAQRCRSRGAAV